MWRGHTGRETLLGGWTNYSDCFIPEVKKLMDQLYSSSGDDAGVSWGSRQSTLQFMFSHLLPDERLPPEWTAEPVVRCQD